MVAPTIRLDPIYLIVRVCPSVSTADGVKDVTILISHDLRERSAVLQKILSLWTRSSFATTVGDGSNKTVQRAREVHKGIETMLMSVRSRLVPSTPYAWRLERPPEPCRRRENRCRAERRDTDQERGNPISTVGQLVRVKDLKASTPSAANVHCHVLHVVVADLDNTVWTFVCRVKAGEPPGYPRFKGCTRFDAFGFTEDGNGFTQDGRHLRLSHIGRVAVRRLHPLEGRITTVRITCRAGRWEAYFVCAGATAPRLATEKDVGIDGGIANPITTNEGEQVAHPARSRPAQRTLCRPHRRGALPTKGNTNRRTDVRILQRPHERRTNRRTDVLHTPVHGLIARSDRIALEDRRITTMVRNRPLATSIVDDGWDSPVRCLTSTAEEAVRMVAPGDPRYPSKT